MAEIDGVPTMSATRTIIDLAASETSERLAIAIDSALRDRLTSEDFLHRRIVELRNRGRAGLGQLLYVLEGGELARGGHSWLERRFLVLLDEMALPRPLTQAVVGTRKSRLIRVDCRFPGTNVVVELLGYRFHRTPMEMQNDSERVNRMVSTACIRCSSHTPTLRRRHPRCCRIFARPSATDSNDVGAPRTLRRVLGLHTLHRNAGPSANTSRWTHAALWLPPK